jgi:hypothetical protein
LSEVIHDIVYLRLVDERKIDFVDGRSERDVWVFTLDGTETDVRVLDEWTEITFEGCTSFHVEGVVVNTGWL